MKELRIIQTPEMEEKIKRLKNYFGEKTNAGVIKKAIEYTTEGKALWRENVETRFFGDLKLEMSDKGLDIYHKEGGRLCFLNKQGAMSLGVHLSKYFPDDLKL